MNKIGKFDFTVEANEADKNGHLTLPAMVSRMLDCACRHAEDRGFGLSSLEAEVDQSTAVEEHARKHTWVMSRLAYELYEMPSLGENYTIISWVENIYRQFTNRCFEIQNREGKIIGYARSIWAMIDMETRKSVDLHALYGENLEQYASDRPCPIEGPARIRMTQAELAGERPVVEHDIDFNGHVNSVRYIEHILDLFPQTPTGNADGSSLPDQEGIQRLDIAYVSEALMGDTLRYFMQKDSSSLYSVELRNQDDKVICRTLLTFASPER